MWKGYGGGKSVLRSGALRIAHRAKRKARRILANVRVPVLARQHDLLHEASRCKVKATRMSPRRIELYVRDVHMSLHHTGSRGPAKGAFPERGEMEPLAMSGQGLFRGRRPRSCMSKLPAADRRMT